MVVRKFLEIKGVTYRCGIFKKASPLTDRCWYISRAGFTEEAKAMAAKRGILFSTEKEIHVLGSKVEKS